MKRLLVLLILAAGVASAQSVDLKKPAATGTGDITGVSAGWGLAGGGIIGDLAVRADSNVVLGVVHVYSATLSASDDSVDVTVSGMTATGQALAIFGTGGVFSPIVICRTDKVTVKSAGDELVAVPVNLFVLKK